MEENYKNNSSEDIVNHPKHYTQASPKVEPIDLLRFLPFTLGNALKYLVRAGHKDDRCIDIKKAVWYLKDFAKNGYSVAPYNTYECIVDTKTASMLFWLFHQNEYARKLIHITDTHNGNESVKIRIDLKEALKIAGEIERRELGESQETN